MATEGEETGPSSPNAKLKETKGMLMSIIRTLSASVDHAQREKEKNRLEKLHKESDKKLGTLVEGNYQDLTSIIQAFSKISGKIQASQDRIRAIKDNLQSCKNLMHCKRDELRKLWIDGIEHKTIVSLLDQIEQVKDVTDTLQGHIDKKQFLHASDILLKSVSIVDGDLSDVEALGEIKVELYTKKEEMYEMLVEELHKQIYVKSTTSIIKSFQRQGSVRQSQRGDKISYLRLALKQAAQQAEADSAAEEALKRLQEVKLEEISAPQQVSEDLNVDPERDPVQYIAILVEALATLRRLPEAIDALRSRIKPGLLAIVQRAAQQVSDTYYLEGEDMSQLDQPQYVLDLLELVFKQFRIVARVHQIILANMSRIKNTMSTLGDFCLYDATEVWSKIQDVLIHVLRDYLDVHRNASVAGAVAGPFTETSTDISAFFSKKRPTRSKKGSLFRFDSSSHAISMSSYLREQRQEVYGNEDVAAVTDAVTNLGSMPLVCKPCAENITVIYKPLQKFMKEVETAVRGPSSSLFLQSFVSKFIKEVYLDQVMEKIGNNIGLATKGYDQQRVTVDLRMQRELGVTKPLLKSTVLVAQSVQELCDLMYVLPDYADQFLSMIVKILQDYRQVSNNTYKNIVSHETEEKRTISATWARDEDINRLLRSLPNWSSLKESQSAALQMTEEDMRAMNSKESSILTSNLASSDILIPQQELLVDSSLLRALGNICESMEWFSHRILDLTSSLGAGSQQLAFTPIESTTIEDLPLISVSENTLMTLRNLAQEYQHLSETCLLVLHLEVRVHCFYYLMPLAKQHNYFCALDDMDPDINVTKLTKDLNVIEEVLRQSLQVPKFRYIFEGLGHLVSTIFINSAQYFNRINENGVKKMCRNIFALQQCLTSVTMSRETDLDRTRQYYELLYLSAEGVLKHVVEHGPMFTEQEYTSLLALQHRSERGAQEGALQVRLGKLNDILVKYDQIIA